MERELTLDAKAKREWKSNQCEKCAQPLRDCVCDEEENTFCCGACGEIVSHSEGEQITNNGFAEFVHRADKCEVALDELAEKQLTPDEIHLAMIEDVSNIVAKYFPNFDNNIETDTWAFLVLFIEETIHQLGKENN